MKLSPAQRAALECIRDNGDVDEFYHSGGYGSYTVKRIGSQALWFCAADKVTDSLLRRGLCISDGRLGACWDLTKEGRAIVGLA